MGKYKDSKYCQVYWPALKKLNEHNTKIPYSTRWLYAHLCLLEHRFSGKKEDFFFHALRELSEETQISYRLVVNGIKTLKELNLIHVWQMHWTDKETGKKSERHITAFRILEV